MACRSHAPYRYDSRMSQYWLPVDSKPTDPPFDSRWYTSGFIPDVVTNCKVLQNKLDVPQLKFYFSSLSCYHTGFSYAQEVETRTRTGARPACFVILPGFYVASSNMQKFYKKPKSRRSQYWLPVDSKPTDTGTHGTVSMLDGLCTCAAFWRLQCGMQTTRPCSDS